MNNLKMATKLHAVIKLNWVKSRQTDAEQNISNASLTNINLRICLSGR